MRRLECSSEKIRILSEEPFRVLATTLKDSLCTAERLYEYLSKSYFIMIGIDILQHGTFLEVPRSYQIVMLCIFALESQHSAKHFWGICLPMASPIQTR